ncbi:MAG: polyphosphate kinase 2 family protein [Acidimicrobiales bacterium]|nr:polyphosphate kinase 2 family protein [Acidimicrobiales bacterium]
MGAGIDGLADLLVQPGEPPRLQRRDPSDSLGLESREQAAELLEGHRQELALLQNRLWAEAGRSLLLVLQGLDASGKDGTIRNVFSGVNPQGCRVASFKVPVGAELAHDYLWRVHAVCPARGEIGIFNRSHYEDIVAGRVRGSVPDDVWRRRFRHVREFERMLADEGTSTVKVFLHLSRDEQRERLQARLDDPEKRWKFRLGDLDDRACWDDYTRAYEETIEETSTAWAPWYVVPADHKWVRNVAVGSLLVHALRGLDPQIPANPEDLSGVVID